MPKCLHRAQFALIAPDLLLCDAVIQVAESGRISAVGTWKGSKALGRSKLVDWGSALLMPGLVNAHTHLELTALHQKIKNFNSFTDWIARLISLRKMWSDEDFRVSTERGAWEAVTSGTTLVGDISSRGVGWKATEGMRFRRVVFEEVLSQDPKLVRPILRGLSPILRQSDREHLRVHGISPHAPYSVSQELYLRAANLARRRKLLLATHVAETKEEIEFLENGTGEFKNFLNSRGFLPKTWQPPNLSPILFLAQMGILGPRTLLIHCNYLDAESISAIRSTGTHVVYCPRSHAFFDHPKHPVRALMEVGVNVALGTDSLASNSSLSMLDEMRFLFKVRKDLTPEQIIGAATLNGASALDCEKTVGCLKRGFYADMAVLKLPRSIKARHLTRQVLEGAGECVATIVGGRVAWQKSKANETLNFEE